MAIIWWNHETIFILRHTHHTHDHYTHERKLLRFNYLFGRCEKNFEFRFYVAIVVKVPISFVNLICFLPLSLSRSVDRSISLITEVWLNIYISIVSPGRVAACECEMANDERHHLHNLHAMAFVSWAFIGICNMNISKIQSENSKKNRWAKKKRKLIT